MPRKVRGRPVSYGAAQLRALDTFLRGEYLMHLSGDSSALLEGEPFHEAGRAYFDPDDFHIAVLEKFDFMVSPWQTSNALTKLGVRSVRRRFENGVQRRIREVPIPKGAECMSSPQEMADYWAKRPHYIGSTIGEEYLAFQREYDLHGASRAAIRFVRGVFAQYPEDWGRDRLLEALDSWDTKEVVSAFHEALEIVPCMDGYSRTYRVGAIEGVAAEFGLTYSCNHFKWFEHEIADSMLQITHEVVPLIEHTSDSGKTPPLRA